MNKLVFVCAVLSPVMAVYVGCGGDADDSLLPEADSGAEAEAGKIHVFLTVDARAIEAAALDAALESEVLADVVDAEDAYRYACVIMNRDGGAAFGDASCNICMSTNCCDDVTACLSLDDCVQRAECVRACDGGAVCKNACKAEHPDSATLLAAVSLCLSGQCESEGCTTYP